jgi:hypothetical protein
MPRPERVLSDDDGPVERFAAGLRELREEAGRPGYRELARRAHYSVTTLSVAAAGRQLPSLAVALAYAQACGGDPAIWEKRWRAVAAELAGSEEVDAAAYQTLGLAGPGAAASELPNVASEAANAGAGPLTVTAEEITCSVADHAERVYGELTPAQQGTARLVLLRLVDVGEGAFVAPRRAPRAEFDRDAFTVIDRFTAAGLLTVTRDTVEVSHEALPRDWPRLRGWADDDREGLRVHRLLATAAADWESLNRDDSALYRGVLLTRARNWLAEHPEAANARERSFLDRSISVQNRAQRARRRLSRTVLVGLLAVVMSLGAVTVSKWTAERSAAGTDDACGSARPDGCRSALARSFADGRADLFVHSGTDLSVRSNVGDTFDAGHSVSVGWEQFHGKENAGHVGRLYLADYNGDDRADLFTHMGTELAVRLNTGDGFDEGRSVSTGWGRFHGRADGNDLGRLYFADYNGDRRADLIVHSESDLSVRLNVGDGFDGGRSISTGWERFHGKHNPKNLGRLYFADYNGDRRADLIVHSESDLSVRLNVGDGFDGGRIVGSPWGLFHGRVNSNHLGRLYVA